MIDMEMNKDGVYEPQKEARTGLWIAGGVAVLGAVGLGAYLWRSRSKSEANDRGGAGQGGGGTLPAGESGGGGGGGVGVGEPPAPSGDTSWTNTRPLPTAADVPGFDLSTNWGTTPTDLRPLFALMERLSGIDGAGRLFATIARRESGFVPNAHNTSKVERDASRRAYANSKDRNPALKYGAQAAEFGSGGLFAGLAPYFLWTGVPEVGAKAPLLSSPPEIMFLPRVAGFGACVYLQRLVANYRLDDHLDVKVGWANPSLLKTGRGNATYQAVRQRFASDANALGIDLDDTKTIPAKLSAARWPGVLKVFAELVGEVPTPIGR
ncbi:MAG: hypothetical protein H6711_15095 [Myxococcales bacterium]|nr:hypothetical protein [Myxococcales bacterium]